MFGPQFRFRLLTYTALASMALGPHAVAQQVQTTTTDETAERASEPTYLSPIVVQATVGGTNPYGEAGPSSVISADEIEQFGGKNLDDVLRATPGVFTRDNVQNPGVAVNIRGLEGSGRVNMMIDGVRQNFRFTGHEAQGFTYVEPAFLAGVDVTRGYVNGVGGGNALMGAVNFRTWDIDDLIKDGKNYGGFVTTTYGTNEAGWSEAAVGAYRFNDMFAVLGGISKRDPGNYENGDGVTVPYTESDVAAGLFKIEFTPDDEQRLEIGANLFHDEFLANSYFQTISSRTYNISYSWDPASELIDFKVNAYRNQVVMDYDYAPSISGGGSAAGRQIDNVGTGFDISNTSRFDLGEVQVKTNYGFEYFADDYNVINSSTTPGSGVNGTGENANYSLFSSTTFSYGIVDLTAGLRYDHSHLDGSGAVTASNPLGMTAGTYEVDRSVANFNPSVTLALNPVEWFNPYVTYAHTSRPPTISETFVGGTHPGGTARMSFFPNPFLEPEESRGWDIGANFSFDDLITSGDSLRIKANYFHNRIDNYIIANVASSGGYYFDNVSGTSTVQGIELQAAYDAGAYFGSISYTHTDSKLPSQTNGFGAQSYLPDDIFSATIGARFLEQRLTVGSRAYIVSESYIGDVNAYGGSSYVSGYGLVDLFANYKLENGLEFSLNVSNVFDKTYTPALSTSPGSAADTGRGRTFFITAKASF